MKILPIVGDFYRPPAKAILAHLGARTPLILRPEPENPYDPNAIAVFIEGANIPEDYDLDVALGGYGTNIAETRARPEIHLGYIPRGLAATLTLSGDLPAHFSFTSGGKAAVEVDLP